MSLHLADRTIAVPEARELELFAHMLEEQGAKVIRCPLISIQDAPDAAVVRVWLLRLIRLEFDDLIIMTGEGILRLLSVARTNGMEREVINALKHVRKIIRGPKPARALKKIGLTAELHADIPTTEGIIAILSKENLSARNVGIQLYGDDPNVRLMTFLRKAGAIPQPVIAYVYAPASDDDHCIELIQDMAAGLVDLIAFTSVNQFRRMREIAVAHHLHEMLALGLKCSKVAAIGPIVAEELRSNFIRVDVVPKERFVLRQFVQEINMALVKKT